MELNYSDRNKGGWLNKKFNYMSLALSCLQFKKYYNKVELVTDSLGYDLLINKFELPYTKVDVKLDDLNDYHPDLWALGKIYAYSIQKEPFIHVDGDVFIYNKFNLELENSPLIVQNIEKGFSFYNDVVKEIEDNFDYIPEEILKSKQNNGQIIAVNAGLLGGSNIEFIQNYSKEAFRFVDENLHKINKINIGMFNTVYEQFLFHALAESRDIQISCYLSNVNSAFDYLAELTDLPSKRNYIHTVGFYKKSKLICDLVEYRLLTDWPDYYFKIIHLLRTNRI
jgi:hypothetical protein